MTGREPAGTFEWRWADIGGEQHRVRFDELAQALGRGRLPPQVLVWRAGWLEWLPAANVPELNHALGSGHSGAPLIVRSDPEAVVPPPPPLAHYARTVPKGTLTLERTHSSSAPPPRPGQRGRAVPAPSEPPPMTGGPIPVRNVMPTLAESAMPGRSNTLRPVGALPPPPRGVQQPKRPPFSSIPPARPGAPPNASRTPLPPAPATRPPLAAPKPPPAPPQRAPVPPVFAAVPSLHIPVGAPQKKPDPSSPRAPSSAPPPPSSRPRAAAATPAPPQVSATPAVSAPVPVRAPAAETPLPVVPAPAVKTAEPVIPAPKDTEPPEETSMDVDVSNVPTLKRDPPAVTEPIAAKREPARAFPRASAEARPAPRAARPAKPEGGGGLSRRAITILTSTAVMIPGVTLLALSLMHPRKHKTPPVASAITVPSVVVAPPAPVGCALEKPAQRLAESAYLAVPALLAPAPDGVNVALGLAAAKEHALGLTIDPTSLAVNTAFEQTVSGSTTLGVVPLVRSGVLEFTVDRAGGALASPRTVDAPKRFSLGATGEGIARSVGSTTELVWPRDTSGKNASITTPRVASIAGTRYAVVFRQGGQDGSVAVGWVREDGTKLSDLRAVKTDATLVGTPAVSADEHQALITFAGKAAATDPWHVELATAPDGALPEQSKPFTLPASGPGGEAISPASEPLGDGRFLLQWTEGSAGNRAVRAQVLSAKLESVGEPVTLSTADQNAGQGALWSNGKQVLALFLVKKEASDELWGATLKCQ